MIDYQTYCQIRHLLTEKKLGLRQIARELKLGLNTVRKWARRESFKPAAIPQRPSKLDPFKGDIVRLLEQHAYSAQQILQQLKERGFQGRYTIIKDFVRQVRPKPRPAFLTLHFAPGECAQVDWGCAGSVPVGSTQRRLSFFIMVLAFSRKMYLEFTLAETLEHFLSCHQRAFEYFNGVVRQVWVDNCKVAVLSRAAGLITFNPRYLDFANHHGFEIRACGPSQPQEKGRVENGVGYVKKNFLHGLPLSDFQAVNPAARYWLDTVANVRVHSQTQKTPQELLGAGQNCGKRTERIGFKRPISTNHSVRRGRWREPDRKRPSGCSGTRNANPACLVRLLLTKTSRSISFSGRSLFCSLLPPRRSR
jgi:transposase